MALPDWSAWRPAMLTDQQILDAASRAGLCFPVCWNLSALAPAAQQDDQSWINDPAIDSPERDLRLEIVESDRQRASEAMAKLRRFAEEVIALAQQVEAEAARDFPEPPRQKP